MDSNHGMHSSVAHSQDSTGLPHIAVHDHHHARAMQYTYRCYTSSFISIPAFAPLFFLVLFFLGGFGSSSSCTTYSQNLCSLSLTHSGQNHWPSGHSCNGGSRHAGWYGSSQRSHSSAGESSRCLLQTRHNSADWTSSGHLSSSASAAFGCTRNSVDHRPAAMLMTSMPRSALIGVGLCELVLCGTP